MLTRLPSGPVHDFQDVDCPCHYLKWTQCLRLSYWSSPKSRPGHGAAGFSFLCAFSIRACKSVDYDPQPHPRMNTALEIVNTHRKSGGTRSGA